MPKDLKQQQNLFIKKSLNRHLGVGGPSTSDHSENSRTSTPTVSEDESGTKGSRGAEQVDTEQRHTPPTRPHRSQAEIAADERAARLKSEQIQAALNDSANEAETSSVGTSSDGRDSRAGDDIKTSKRPMKNKRDHSGRGGYRGGYRGKFDRRDSGRMGHGHGHFPRGPRPMNMIPFQHRPPPPIHMLEQLSQSPRDSAFIPSPRRTPRHSESSSCGSPRLYSGTGQTPPQSPRHFYESPIQSPLRHHISPYNSPPRHPASPIPRMMHPPEHMIRPHPAMMARQHPMPGSIPIPMPPQPDVGAFSGTPPPQFHPMNNPHMQHMAAAEQQHIVAAMQQQQRAMEQQQHQHQQQQQLEQQQHLIAQQMKMKQSQDSFNQMMQMMQKMTVQGQNVTLTHEQCAQLMSMLQQQGVNMMPGGQNVVPPWMPQGVPQPEMMMNPTPPQNPDVSSHMMHQMGQHIHPMFLQQQQLQGFMPGQTLPGQPLPGQPLPAQPIPGQPLPGQPLPGQALPGQPVPGSLPGAIPVQHFMQSQLQSQQIMIPRPIHPEMGNTSNITPPQNRNLALMDPAQGMPPPQFGLQNMPVPQVTQPHLAPAMDAAVSSPSLQVEDTKSSVIETSTDAPIPVTGQTGTLPVNTSKSTEVPPVSTEVAPSVTKPSSVPVTPVKQSTKTPGLIRLPQDHQLPTEEDLLKSPDAAGTPVNMKKNYWQNRQKSSESSEKKAPPEINPLREEPEKTAADQPVSVGDVKIEKKEAELPPDTAALPSKPAAEVAAPAETPKKKPENPRIKGYTLSDLGELVAPAETPKKKPEKPKTKGFNLSDLGELVTKTVTHNNNIPKTDISAAVNSGSVEVVLNQGYRRTHSPCQAKAVDARDRESDTWRPLTKHAPEEEPSGSWRVPDNPAGAAKILEDDPERTRVLQEAEAKALSTGHQIQYAIEKLQKQSRNKSVSESSSKSVKEEVAGEEAWYDEEDEDRIDCFDLTI